MTIGDREWEYERGRPACGMKHLQCLVWFFECGLHMFSLIRIYSYSVFHNTYHLKAALWKMHVSTFQKQSTSNEIND